MNTFTIDDNQYDRFVTNAMGNNQYTGFVTNLIKTTTSSGRLERISVIKSKEEVNYIPPLGIECKEGGYILRTLAEEYNIDTIAIINPESVQLIVPYLGHEAIIYSGDIFPPNTYGLLDHMFMIIVNKIEESRYITRFEYNKITKCCKSHFYGKVHEDVIDIVNIASRYIEEYM